VYIIKVHQSRFMFLNKEIKTLKEMINHSKVKELEVSSNGIDWHIDHTLKAILVVSKILKKSDPSKYQRKYNLLRSVIFISGKIPRGKGKAPRSVLPPENILKKDLHHQFDEAVKALNEIENMPANSNFKHPYFGQLDLRLSMRFLDIHTNHHLKIMNDILRSQSK